MAARLGLPRRGEERGALRAATLHQTNLSHLEASVLPRLRRALESLLSGWRDSSPTSSGEESQNELREMSGGSPQSGTSIAASLFEQFGPAIDRLSRATTTASATASRDHPRRRWPHECASPDRRRRARRRAPEGRGGEAVSRNVGRTPQGRLPPAALADARRVLDGAARRLLAAQLDGDAIPATSGGNGRGRHNRADEGAAFLHREPVEVPGRNGHGGRLSGGEAV